MQGIYNGSDTLFGEKILEIKTNGISTTRKMIHFFGRRTPKIKTNGASTRGANNIRQKTKKFSKKVLTLEIVYVIIKKY